MIEHRPAVMCGHVTVEYALVTGLLLVALFIPLPVLGESAVTLLMGALKSFQANTTYLLSLP